MKFSGVKIFLSSLLYINAAVFGFSRGFDGIFPDTEPAIKEAAFSGRGYYNSLELKPDKTYSFTVQPAENSGIAISENFRIRQPEYLIESLIILPHPDNKEITVLDIYNAVINVRQLAKRKYYSFTRKKEVPLFEAVTRINNLKNKKAIADPPKARAIPEREAVYSRVKDVNFGNCYYLSELHLNSASISYILSNAEDISLFFFTVIKKGNITIQFHIEPVDEGILIYALSAIVIEPFAAASVDIPSATKKRFDVVKDWIEDGINGKF
jgi:hypothetical protein